MKEQIENWLRDKWRVPGVFAATVCHPDKTVSTQSWSPDFEASSVERALHSVMDSFTALQSYQLPAESVCWEFERACLYCTRRRDQTCLGLFANKDRSEAFPEQIEKLLSEFQDLPWEI